MNHDLTQEQRLWRYRIFTLTWLGYAGFYLCRKNLSVIKPELSDLNILTDYQYAWMTGGYSAFYAFGQFCNGVLSDRFGARLIVSMGLFLSVLANFFMGFLYAMPILMIMLVCLNGYAQSTGWSGLVKMMAGWYRPNERGVVMAWWGTNYVLGGFIATNFATFCMYRIPIFESLGWQRGFWYPAVALSVIAFLFALFSRNDCDQAGIDEIIHEKTEVNKEELEKDIQSGNSLAILFEVMSHPTVWVIAGMYFFLKLTRYSFLFWLPDYLSTDLAFSNEEAGYVSSVYELLGFGGALAAGYMSDWVFGSRRMSVGAIFLWCLAIIFLLEPTLSAHNRWFGVVAIAFIGFFTYGPDTLMTGAAAQDVGGKHGAATAAGLINGVGSCGQFLAGFITAYFKENYGWDALFYLFAVLVFIGGCLLATKWNYRAVVEDD